jgi:hypothetical protein
MDIIELILDEDSEGLTGIEAVSINTIRTRNKIG